MLMLAITIIIYYLSSKFWLSLLSFIVVIIFIKTVEILDYVTTIVHILLGYLPSFNKLKTAQ